MKYEYSLLQKMYKDGLLSSKVLMYHDICTKIDSLPPQKLSVKVRIVAQSMGVSTDTIYRAIRMFK